LQSISTDSFTKEQEERDDHLQVSATQYTLSVFLALPLPRADLAVGRGRTSPTVAVYDVYPHPSLHLLSPLASMFSYVDSSGRAMAMMTERVAGRCAAERRRVEKFGFELFRC
jgi:hypothetical protein